MAVAHECLKAGDERFITRFAHADGLSDGGHNEIGVRDRRQADEAGTIQEILGKPVGDGEGQSGLAHAARSGQRKQPNVRSAREFNQRRDLSLTANKRREREG
jgi:hypothetical protein